MTQKEKEKLKRYVRLKSSISLFKKELSDIEDDVKKIIEKTIKENGDEVLVDTHKITLQVKRKWEFPEYVEDAKNILEELKEKAKAIGDAENVETISLVVRKNES